MKIFKCVNCKSYTESKQYPNWYIISCNCFAIRREKKEDAVKDWNQRNAK